MKRYVALLRGVNISGKNKISMPELKTAFAAKGYEDVRTHLNSGNVIFSTDDTEEEALAAKINELIRTGFELDIPVFVILQETLAELLDEAPDWWGTEDKELYDNLIFIIPPATAEEIAEKIGEPTKELERVLVHKNVIFWSFDRKKYAKANYWKKTAGEEVRDALTIRTANTLKKIAGM